MRRYYDDFDEDFNEDYEKGYEDGRWDALREIEEDYLEEDESADMFDLYRSFYRFNAPNGYTGASCTFQDALRPYLAGKFKQCLRKSWQREHRPLAKGKSLDDYAYYYFVTLEPPKDTVLGRIIGRGVCFEFYISQTTKEIMVRMWYNFNNDKRRDVIKPVFKSGVEKIFTSLSQIANYMESVVEGMIKLLKDNGFKCTK